MYDILVFLLTYLFAFGISAWIWMFIDFSKIVKSEHHIHAIIVYWFFVIITSYIVAHIIFDFADAISASIN